MLLTRLIWCFVTLQWTTQLSLSFPWDTPGDRRATDDIDFISNVPQLPLVLEGPPPYLLYRTGESIALHCSASGTDVRFSWYKDNAPVCLDCGETLEFGTSNNTAEGTYQCRVSNRYGVAVSNKTFVQKAKMELTVLTSTKYRFKAIAGSVLELPCNGTISVPSPIYRWYRCFNNIRHGRCREEEIGSDAADLDHMIIDNGSLLITNVNINSSHYIYRCEIHNLVLKTKKKPTDFSVQVVAGTRNKESYMAYSSDKKVIVAKGETASLYCIFHSRLPVQWTLNNGRQIAQRAIYKSYSVRISDVQTSDGGSYKCSDGSDEYKIQLIVEETPVIVVPPKSQVTCDHSVVFECNASGRPAAHITWFINDLPANDVKDHLQWVQVNQRSQSQLYLEKLPNHFTAVIHCNASNRHGYQIAAAHVIVAEEKCHTTTVESTTVTTVTLRQEMTTNGGTTSAKSTTSTSETSRLSVLTTTHAITAAEQSTIFFEEESLPSTFIIFSHLRSVLILILPLLFAVFLLAILIAIIAFIVRQCRKPTIKHPRVAYKSGQAGKFAASARVMLPPTDQHVQGHDEDDDHESDNDSGLGDP